MVSLLIPFMPSRKPVISEVIIDYKNTDSGVIDNIHTCDKVQRGIREVFLSFPGGF